MRYLILSDIHGNIDALDAVLSAAAKQTWDRQLVLGDLVGYGGDPNGVVDRVRAMKPLIVIRGNHDKAASGLDDASDFNPVARQAAHWTLRALTPPNRAYLAELQAGPQIVDDRLEICHGAPFDEDMYIFDETDAVSAIRAARRPICLFGHTHVPVVFSTTDRDLNAWTPGPAAESALPLREDTRYLINPGSVGQPRDGSPLAAYATLDTDRLELMIYRVPYDIERAQQRIVAAGLPASLSARLATGR